jgi:hypothetical protein
MLMNNIQIIHFDRMMVYENFSQKQVLYLQLHNRFLSSERDWMGHELILKRKE